MLISDERLQFLVTVIVLFGLKCFSNLFRFRRSYYLGSIVFVGKMEWGMFCSLELWQFWY